MPQTVTIDVHTCYSIEEWRVGVPDVHDSMPSQYSYHTYYTWIWGGWNAIIYWDAVT